MSGWQQLVLHVQVLKPLLVEEKVQLEHQVGEGFQSGTEGRIGDNHVIFGVLIPPRL